MMLSERLKELRLKAGYTQEELAKKIGIAQPNYQRWEKGRSNPKKDSLENLASVLNVSVSYLLGETNVRSGSEINEIMEKLSEQGQVKTVQFAKKTLSDEQEEENKIIQFKSSLIPYEVEEEQALSAGLGEGYTDCIDKEIVWWDRDVSYDRAIRIKGDSMEPEFHSGEIALIRNQDWLDHSGQVCAVDDVESGKAYIKKVTEQIGGLLLESINDSKDEDGERLFPDIFIPFENKPRIIGKVITSFMPIPKEEI